MHLLAPETSKDRSFWTEAPDGAAVQQFANDQSSTRPSPTALLALGPTMDHLDALEAQSIYIFREAFARLKKLALLWSLGKDSNVMIWLARKAFFGHMPFPALHVDTGKKFPEMYAFRDRYGKEWQLDLRI
ncbi:MAG: phosphoadenosine phosphosulfate reductase family protein, partial [Bradyrhizobium sp.]